MEWKIDFEEAEKYYSATVGLYNNKKVDNITLYHILCLSVEKYAAVLSSLVEYLPEHSSLTFVFREVGKKMEIPAEFTDEVRFLNRFMNYCSLDIQEAVPVSNEEMERMISFLKRLQKFVIEKTAATEPIQ
jgi:hypothetical protein